MKIAAKILLLASVVFVFAMIGLVYGQTVEENNSIVFFKTNVYLLDDTNNPLHTRVSGGALMMTGGTMLGDVDMGTTNSIKAANGIEASSVSSPLFNSSGGIITNASELHSSNVYATAITGSRISANSVTSEAVTISGTSFQMASAFSMTGDTNDYGTNVLMATGTGKSINFQGADGTYPKPGGTIYLTPGTSAGQASRVEVTRGGLASEKLYAGKLFLTNNVGFTVWLFSDGTNLFFASSHAAGFTNALTTNAP